MANTDTQTTVIPLADRDGDDAIFGPLRKKLNKTLMVAWINADLFERAANDVRKSTVFYDADGDFLTAITSEAWAAVERAELVDEFLLKMFQQTNARFYSIGLK